MGRGLRGQGSIEAEEETTAAGRSGAGGRGGNERVAAARIAARLLLRDGAALQSPRLVGGPVVSGLKPLGR